MYVNYKNVIIFALFLWNSPIIFRLATFPSISQTHLFACLLALLKRLVKRPWHCCCRSAVASEIAPGWRKAAKAAFGFVILNVLTSFFKFWKVGKKYTLKIEGEHWTPWIWEFFLFFGFYFHQFWLLVLTTKKMIYHHQVTRMIMKNTAQIKVYFYKL